MAGYFLDERVPWTTQPPSPVDIDRSNPITRGLVAVGCPTLYRENLLSGTLAKVARPRGLSYSGTMRLEVGESYSLSNPHTAFTLFRTEVTVTALAVHTSHSSAGTSFWMGQGNAGEMYISAGGLANGGTYSLNRDYAIAGVFLGATVYEYVDGVQAATASNSTSGTGKLVLMALGAGGFSCLGSVALSLAFNRALSAGEIASLSRNPWQIFAPRVEDIWVPVSASGTTISGALGTATASGHTGNVNANRTIAGALGTATASGFQGTVSNSTDTTIAGNLGTAVASGFQGTVSNSTDTTISGALGTAVASGFTGTIDANRTIAGALGTATASGFQGTVSNSNDTTISGSLGTAVASGFTGTVSYNRIIAGSLGTAVASGFTGTVQNGIAAVYTKNANLYLGIGSDLSIVLGNPRMPNWNTAGRPAAPLDYVYGFNTDTSAIEVWTGSAWV